MTLCMGACLLHFIFMELPDSFLANTSLLVLSSTLTSRSGYLSCTKELQYGGDSLLTQSFLRCLEAAAVCNRH